MLKVVEKTNKQEEQDRFVVDNDKKATWCLRKIKHMKKKQKENEELAESQIEEIQQEINEVKAWLEDENGKLQNKIEFMENKLHNYAVELREDNPDLKTHKLPFGQLQFRKRRPKWKYDNEKLLQFVKSSLKEALKIKEKVDKRKLKKEAEVVGNKAVIKDTGEIVEGVKIIERPEKFKVKIDI